MPGVKRLLPLLASVVANLPGDAASEKFVGACWRRTPTAGRKPAPPRSWRTPTSSSSPWQTNSRTTRKCAGGLSDSMAKRPPRRSLPRARRRQSQQELTKLLKERYADIVPDLSVGWKAPEVIGRGLDGKEMKLSDLKGKVVVLDIWATWCVPCRAMIPQERAIVEKLKTQPFVLVSISVDHQKETLTKFLAEGVHALDALVERSRGGHRWRTGMLPISRRFTSSTPKA